MIIRLVKTRVESELTEIFESITRCRAVTLNTINICIDPYLSKMFYSDIDMVSTGRGTGAPVIGARFYPRVPKAASSTMFT